MAYTPSSGTSQLIAGPTLRTLSSAEDNMGGFIAPENQSKPQKQAPFPVKLKNSGPLLDNSGRIATDLRISLTDKCNLRCIYCMPAEGLQWLPKDNLLSAEEIIRLADVAISELGVEEIRFTGGEPLVRADLVDIIAGIHALHPEVPLAMTTNGIGLEKRAQALVDAGMTRINVSLDTICPETFAKLTRRDKLASVLRGVEGAAAAGLSPVKINAVLMPGVNDTQAPELLDWALQGGYQLRFIEQMPLDADNNWTREGTITAAQIRALLSERFVLGATSIERGDSPAQLWEVYPLGTELDADGFPVDGRESLGQVGIIASVTEPFCGACTRTRLTADGKIRSCLFSQTETDLMELIRSGASDEELALRWREGMWFKPRAHGKNSDSFTIEEFAKASRSMSAIGG
ncbi:MAG: GTP 3',8-cyclase MoaA [Rothia sp. (in: high G+C Gram-positive bacteria)]|uniref:GTP 3',8-cyclase MoaA n=1 Tax=Rothia sp. (in: high G+C Gram-positive bacteria) TaxID=1885016 RepID=UPI0026E0CB2A|nr:GTP 3',8-cyclase MoaA [Rothia sp. (in: high G+C Gram-positive bacteria)]MDO5749923.1 GTP 3',8-cyclase MoaA [Rothia sp. (in: high G+C Gram-positive bacteria)]